MKKYISQILVSAFVLMAFHSGIAFAQKGHAVYYSDWFQGRTTASGEIFDQNALTAAHKKLPFGTQVRVTNLENNSSVVVTINDRMPTRNSNIIDLSKRAAEELGLIKKGRAQVNLEVID